MHTGVINESQVRTPRLENPFSKANDVSCDLLLVPSQGTFLEDFKKGTGLHIAIIDGHSRILEFDRGGVRCHTVTIAEIRWQQCLRLKFIDYLLSISDDAINLSDIEDVWDQTVELFLGEEKAAETEPKYDPDKYNCFDFAITFLARFIDRLNLDHQSRPEFAILRKILLDKVSFCERLVLPITKRAAKYISAYRRKRQIA